MSADARMPDPVAIPPHYAVCFARQKQAAAADRFPSRAARVQSLRALARLLDDHRDAIVHAISADFGNRSTTETLLAEYLSVSDSLRHAVANLASWMKPRSRRVDTLVFPGARNRVVPQPLGVVGVIVPWNFPLLLSFSPLVAIVAAGNRAMVKMSEKSPQLAELLREVSPQYLPEDTLTFLADDGTQGPAFASLPFDHLLFTGSTVTGRAVMAAAARNLTPVTLELGGKNPAIVGPDADFAETARRIMWAKLLNAGQACTSIDYVFVPAGRVGEFVACCAQAVAARYPDIASDDYTSLIDAQAMTRLHRLLDDARERGATIVELAPHDAGIAAARKFPPCLVRDVTDDMAVMREEIFGPILPVLPYDSERQVADYINSRDTPLALYYFTDDRKRQSYYIDNIRSGGVSVNEAHMHQAQYDLPFGGVGASGMGQYHSCEGFETFSHMRPVFHQGPISTIQRLLQPPYGRGTDRLIRVLMAWKKLR